MINSAVLICSILLPLALLGGSMVQDVPQADAVQSACEHVYSAVLPIAGTAVDKIAGTFYDDYLDRDLTGCMIVVSGGWGDIAGRSNPGDSVYKLLSDQGWKQEPQYSADGPDGTFFALSKGDVWCFVRGQWDGGDDADSTYVPSDFYQFVIICARLEGIGPGAIEDE